MAWFAIAATVASTVMQYAGQRQAAKAAQSQAAQAQAEKNFEAAQMEQSAGQEVAAAQRRAQEQRRRASLVASRAQAVAAASGAGASDSTIENIISDIAGEGEYRALLEMYSGEEQARKLRMGAQGARMEGSSIAQFGESRARAYNTAALGSLAGGASSLYDKYGMGGPQRSSALDGSIYDSRFTDMSDPRFG